MKQHKASLQFFSDSGDSGRRWRTLVPDGEDEEWTRKYLIWVLPTVNENSTAPNAEDVEGVRQFQIYYDAFVRGTVADPSVLHIDAQNDEAAQAFDQATVEHATVNVLKAYCCRHGILFPADENPTKRLMVAIVKKSRGWPLTTQQQASSNQYAGTRDTDFVHAECEMESVRGKKRRLSGTGAANQLQEAVHAAEQKGTEDTAPVAKRAGDKKKRGKNRKKNR